MLVKNAHNCCDCDIILTRYPRFFGCCCRPKHKGWFFTKQITRQLIHEIQQGGMIFEKDVDHTPWTCLLSARLRTIRYATDP